MATFSFDNDRNTVAVDDVHYDQTTGVQTPPDGNEIDIFLTSGQIDGLDADFETFLAGLGLTTAQKDFAAGGAGKPDTEAASSSSTFIQVTADVGETLNDLKLVADSSTALTGLQTLSGGSIYVHVDATGNYATLWTTSDNSGHIVGALGLTNETIDNVTTHTATAGVQMVFFEAIKHTDTGSNDESVSLSDVLKIAVDTAVSFDFHQLDAGNFLWAAVGDGDAAMLITGQDLNVIDTPGKLGDKVNSGSTDPTDTVNTSKASDTTIGINAQHFAPTNSGDGATAVFTFVSGFAPLQLATPQYTGQNITQIDYDSYLNISSVSFSIVQETGGTPIMKLSLWEAGGGDNTEHAIADLQPEEGYSAPGVVDPYSYIGNQDTDSNLRDDTPVDIASVKITRGGTDYVFASSGTNNTINVTVTFNGNYVTVSGALKDDVVSLTAANDPSDPDDGTFNRLDVQPLFGGGTFDIGTVNLSAGGLTPAGLGSHLFVDDDGPALTPQANGSLTPNNLEVGNVLNAQDSSSYTPVPGTDGQKSLIIQGPADSTGDFTWSYFDVNGDTITGNNEIKGFYKGNALYTLIVNSDGTYTFKMIGTLAGSDIPLSSNVIHAGGPTDTVDVAAKAPSTDFARIVGDDGTNNPLVNASHGYVGVDNGNLDNGESLTLTLHEANGDLIDFSELKIGTKSAGTSHYDYTIHMSDGSDVVVNNVEVGKNGTIDVLDPDTSDNVLIESVTIFKVDGNAIKIGLSNIHFITPPPDVQLGFTFELKDGDNDTTTQSFTVDIDGNNDGNFDATVNSAATLPTAPVSSLSLLGSGHTSDSMLSLSHMAHHDMFIA